MFQNFKGNFFRFWASLGISTQIFRLNGVFPALSILIKHLHNFSQDFTFPTLIMLNVSYNGLTTEKDKTYAIPMA